MDILVTDLFMKILLVSSVFSILEMAFVQKIKILSFIKKGSHIEIFNIISSLFIGPLFSMSFFDLNFFEGLWVSFFSFIGASSIYNAMQNQNMINYKPKSLSELKKTRNS